MQRRILGVAAVLFLLAAVAIRFWRPDEMAIELAFFGRMGALLLAAWLAYEDVQRLPGWLLVVLPVALDRDRALATSVLAADTGAGRVSDSATGVIDWAKMNVYATFFVTGRRVLTPIPVVSAAAVGSVSGNGA